MKIVTAAQMTAVEQASELAGVSTDVLMENAGLAVAQGARDLVGAAGVRVMVLVGPGNNGADGLVAARHLRRWGAEVTCFVVAGRPDTDPKMDLALEYGVRVIDAIGAEPVGQVSALQGSVSIIRTDGTRVQADDGDPIYQGDVIETGTGGAIGITFADQRTFSLADNGSMVIDEMVYDATSQSGKSAISVAEGLFTFVSGQIAKTSVDASTISTPMATIGIRGTKIAGVAAAEGGENTISLLPDDARLREERFQNGHMIAIYWETVTRWIMMRAKRDAAALQTPLFLLQAADASSPPMPRHARPRPPTVRHHHRLHRLDPSPTTTPDLPAV